MNELESGQFRSDEERQASIEFGKAKEKERSVEQEKLKPFDAVIVLGGGMKESMRKTFQQKYPEEISPRGVKIEKSIGTMLTFDTKMRTIAAAEMYLNGLTKKLIFSEGMPTDKDTTESGAAKMKSYAQDILERAGISREESDKAIILEDKAANTIENIANVCNIIDQNPEEYENLAVLSNQYHLERAQKLLGKFGIEAKGVSAEERMPNLSDKYQKVIDRFFASSEYQKRLATERRFIGGLDDVPRYWFPQAVAVDNSDRLMKIVEQIYGPALANKLGKDAIVKGKESIRETKRKIPPEDWGKMKIYLARHGESTHNVSEIPYFAGGSSEQDVPLTPKGVESAKLVANELRKEGVDILVCSDLKRSKETAEIISDELKNKPEVVVLDGLREVYVGELTGKTREQIQQEGSEAAKKALDLFLSGDIKQINFPGGDTFETAASRVRESLDKILIKYGTKAKIAIVGHGNINKVMLSLLFPDDGDFIRQLDLSHEKVVEFEMKTDDRGNTNFENMKIHGEGEAKGLI